MAGIKRASRWGLAATLVAAVAACATRTTTEASGRNNNNSGSARGGEVRIASGMIADGPTELWIHGALNSPQAVRDIGAHGARGVVNLRTFKAEPAIKLMQQYADLGLGACMTVRWKDPGGQVHLDVPPDAAESSRILDDLMTALTSSAARQMDGKLWVQFYNELGSGAGHVEPERADGMFEFATRAAERIRAEAPHVKISGPAMTGVEPSDDARRLNARQRAVIDLNERILKWTVEHADAADIHLHTDSVDKARKRITKMREYLDELPGGERVKLVAWEWSPAFYHDRNNQTQIRKLILDVWALMNEYNLENAAYGSLYPAQHFGDTFGWQALYAKKGQPNEPFFSTVKAIAMKTGPGDPQEKQPERIRRRNRRQGRVITGSDSDLASMGMVGGATAESGAKVIKSTSKKQRKKRKKRERAAAAAERRAIKAAQRAARKAERIRRRESRLEAKRERIRMRTSTRKQKVDS